MKSNVLRTMAKVIEDGCEERYVYSLMSEFYMNQTIGMFLADAKDPWQGLTRDEVVTGLCLAAAAIEGTDEDNLDTCPELEAFA